MATEWSRTLQALEREKTNLTRFEVHFFDESNFKKFMEEIEQILTMYEHICLAGYFSEAMTQAIFKVYPGIKPNIRVLSPRLGKTQRDQDNLKALRKLADKGIIVRVHSRLHCRMFLAYTINPKGDISGSLILGSFDFNNEGMLMTKRNAGIFTYHPDLVKSAITYYNEIFAEPRDSMSLEEMYPEK